MMMMMNNLELIKSGDLIYLELTWVWVWVQNIDEEIGNECIEGAVWTSKH